MLVATHVARGAYVLTAAEGDGGGCSNWLLHNDPGGSVMRWSSLAVTVRPGQGIELEMGDEGFLRPAEGAEPFTIPGALAVACRPELGPAPAPELTN